MFKFGTFCAELGRKHLELHAGTLGEIKLRITPSFYNSFSMSYIWLSCVPGLKKCGSYILFKGVTLTSSVIDAII